MPAARSAPVVAHIQNAAVIDGDLTRVILLRRSLIVMTDVQEVRSRRQHFLHKSQRSSAALPFDLALNLRRGDRLPSHVPRRVLTTTRERHDVIDRAPGARFTGLPPPIIARRLRRIAMMADTAVAASTRTASKRHHARRFKHEL
jgi:hypothetical protein